VIQQVGEHDIRDTGKGLHVEANVGDDVLVELIARAAERYEGTLTAYGPASLCRRWKLPLPVRIAGCGLRRQLLTFGIDDVAIGSRQLLGLALRGIDRGRMPCQALRTATCLTVFI
jgi:hypothetical protein